jgi:hypothetical protein
MKQKVNFISKDLGLIEIWDDQIKKLQIIEDSKEWYNLHGIVFQSRVNYWKTKMCSPNYSYKCKHFEIHYKINEEGFIRITEVKF